MLARSRSTVPSRFNPRLRAGGDLLLSDVHMGVHVSIRASAREATTRCAITRRGTNRFNPRLRAGGDPDQGVASGDARVSIRASAREAT